MSAAVLLVACSYVPTVTPVPAHAAAGVPVDVRPAIYAHYLDTFEVALVDAAAAAEIPISLTTVPGPFGTWYLVTPDLPLQAGTMYELQMRGTQEAQEDLDQTAWFTTGEGQAAVPDRPVIRTLFASHAVIDPEPTGGLCIGGDVDYVEVDVTPDPGVAFYEVELRRPDHAPAVIATRDLAITTSWSGFPPPLEGGSDVCVTVTAIGLDGSRSPASAEACTEVAQCTRSEGDYDHCASSGCSASGAGASPWLLLIAAALAATARSATRARRRGWAAGRRSR